MAIPIEEVNADDFVMVRAALVKRCKGANEALVWERIRFRNARQGSGKPYLRWEASYPEIGEQVGLTARQVQRAVDTLVGADHLEREQLAGSNRVYSYMVKIGRGAQGTERSDGVGSDHSVPPENRTVAPGVTERSSAPLSKTLTKEVEKPAFDRAWAHWPKKTDKWYARKKFDQVVKSKQISEDDLVVAIVTHGDAHALYTETRFVRGLSVWLNKASWDNPLPEPERGRSTQRDRVAEELAELQRLRDAERGGDQLAIGR